MDTRQLQDEILRLKKEKDFCILAHSYMTKDVAEIADFTGDSYKLATLARTVKNRNILMCGVRFMAETAKLLSPEKRVILSRPEAGCPMAEQMTKAEVLKFREEHPDYSVVAYVNTTADLKTVADVCVTSSSAVKIVKNMKAENIYFIPDPNLGSFVAQNCPDKNIKVFSGGCPVHSRITLEEAEKAKKLHPGALLLVHPECRPEVSELADYVGSTSGIVEFAKKSDAREFIIGTENAIVQALKFACPDKRFYELSKKMVCLNMKLTTLPDVYDCLTGRGGEEITFDEETQSKAPACINKMIELGG